MGQVLVFPVGHKALSGWFSGHRVKVMERALISKWSCFQMLGAYSEGPQAA